MTSGEAVQFEKGKTYKMFVLFVSKKAPYYINVMMKGGGGCFSIEVSGVPNIPVPSLKDKIIDCVCTEVTDKGPEFVLAPKFYEKPHPPTFSVTSSVPRVKGSQIGLAEGPCIEFKRSLIFSPRTGQPDSDQPFEIAKEIAAFMNTAGGDLYLGVDDNGFVKGVENDLMHLGEAPIMMDKVMDDKYQYKPNLDGFITKLTTAMRCYLGTAAAALVNVEVVSDTGSNLNYVKVHVNPSKEIIYLGREESVVYRAQSSVLYLKGRQRELYVKERFYNGDTDSLATTKMDDILKKLAAQLKSIDDMKAEIVKTMEKGLQEEFRKSLTNRHENGPIITVSGGQPFTKDAVTAVKKPKELAWEGQHYAEVGGWQELVLKVLEKLQEINAAKFDELAGMREFTRQLVIIQRPRERHSDCYSTKFGAEGKIRIKKSIGNKAYLWREDMALRKIIAAFGVDVSKFMFVAG